MIIDYEREGVRVTVTTSTRVHSQLSDCPSVREFFHAETRRLMRRLVGRLIEYELERKSCVTDSSSGS